MRPAFTLRSPEWPQDAAALADLLTASLPEQPTTAERLLHEQQSRDPALFVREWVAQGPPGELRAELLAFARLSEDAHSDAPGLYRARLEVRPDARQSGVGGGLYAALLEEFRARGGGEVSTLLNAGDAAGLAFLTRRGWRESWRRRESRLTVGAGEALPLPEVGDLRLRPLSEVMADDPQHGPRLHALDHALRADIPSPHPANRETPLEQWVQSRLHAPRLRPALSFVLEDGAGQYVGYTTLQEEPGSPDPFYTIGMTGVLPGYRGRGLARALKLASMRALSAAGGGEIRTWNDAPNLAMLHLNAALGFVLHTEQLLYTLRAAPRTEE